MYEVLSSIKIILLRNHKVMRVSLCSITLGLNCGKYKSYLLEMYKLGEGRDSEWDL